MVSFFFFCLLFFAGVVSFIYLFFSHSPIEYEFFLTDLGIMVRVFANSPGDLGSIPGRVIPKDSKNGYLTLPCLTLSIIRQGSRVKGSNPGKGVDFSVVAIKKGAFGSTSTYFIWPTDETLTGTTSQQQSVPGSNGTHTPELQNWTLTVKCSLLSCTRHPFRLGV